jgi:hypothetical protein
MGIAHTGVRPPCATPVGCKLLAALALSQIAGPLAARATTVTGHVTDASTQAPLAGAEVQIVDDAWPPNLYAVLDASGDGAFAWTGTCQPSSPDGMCYVIAYSPGFLQGSHAFQPSEPSIVADIALTPAPRATISGTVRDAVTHQPLNGIYVYDTTLQFGNWSPDDLATSDVNGHFSFNVTSHFGVDRRICAGGIESGVAQQCFDHHDQSDTHLDFTPIVVNDGDLRSGVDFDLVAGGRFRGTLRDGYTGGVLANAPATIFLIDDLLPTQPDIELTTDATGGYEIRGVSDGTYYIAAWANQAFVDWAQAYPGIACPDGCPFDLATPLTVQSGSTVDGIDFTFHPDIVLSGRVTDAVTGNGVGNADLGAYGRYFSFFSNMGRTTSRDDGSFDLYARSAVAALYVTAEGAPPLIGAVYPGIPCIANGGASCIANGGAISVTSGDRLSGIDLQLGHGGAVAGQVLDARTSTPVQAVVTMYDQNFQIVWSGYSDVDGRYASPAWTAGTVYAKAELDDPYGCAFYDGAACPVGTDSPATVNPTPIVTQVGAIREGIDFHLAPDAIFANGFDPRFARPAAPATRIP